MSQLSLTSNFAFAEAEPGDEGAVHSPATSRMRTLGTVLVSPLSLLFRLTCPKCHYDSPQARLYPVTFTASFVWVTVLSTVIPAIVTRWATISSVPRVIFGLMIVATGAEVPDMVQSITVARRGYGSMAAGNAMGSQILNMLVGLGGPWLVANLVTRRAVRVTEIGLLRTAALFQSGNVAVVLTTLVLTTLVLRRRKAVLDRKRGTVLLVSYLVTVLGYLLVAYFGEWETLEP